MHMDLYHLREEAEPSDRTALEAVVDHIKAEMARLNVRFPRACACAPEARRVAALRYACATRVATLAVLPLHCRPVWAVARG
jgi:hypothetical protein